MTVFEEIAEALDRLDDKTVDLVRRALDRGEDPLQIIEQEVEHEEDLQALLEDFDLMVRAMK